jgi:magnesium transporter
LADSPSSHDVTHRRPDGPGSSGSGVGCRAEFFDFRDRTFGDIEVTESSGQIEAGRFVWIDIDCDTFDPLPLAKLLPMESADTPALTEILDKHAQSGRRGTSFLTRGGSFMHIVLLGAAAKEQSTVAGRLDLVLTEHFLLTLRRGPNALIDAVRADYISDFINHGKSQSFLIYEIFSNHVEQLLSLQGAIEEDVDQVRLQLTRSVDTDAINRLAAVSGKLLSLRKLVLPERRMLEEIASRKTNLISDATLEFLGRMIESLERLLADIAVDLEILENAMNFSLTVTAHRTNQSMNRLAVISTIFLPLTFLCGVYGMNFEVIPEFRWRYGYIYFWVLSGVISTFLFVVLRRARLL